MERMAKLTFEGHEIELPIEESVEGELAIDISSLRAKTGATTLDRSLASTALCRSDITYIDGDKGILRYRGIPIEDLVHRPNFIEIAWLLIFGELPKREELSEFSGLLSENQLLHEGLRHQFQHIPVDAPPMAILSAMLSNLACYHQEFLTVEDTEQFTHAAARLISKVRTIAAFSYRRSRGLPIIHPDPSLRYCANFLHMMFSVPYKHYVLDPEIEDALNLIFILHADHEQNCSTATVRTVGSSRANVFASCAAGVCALWGPLHGGANVEVINMLEKIAAGGLEPEDCIRMAKDKESGFLLHGFGHRVYKNYDPRAKILRETCERVFKRIQTKDPLLDIARKLEELALKDSYFVDRKLYPNVDFYSGIILRAMGIPTNMFTVCFAIGRLPGWVAHWKEQHEDATARIIRPRQVYLGPKKHGYTLMRDRE